MRSTLIGHISTGSQVTEQSRAAEQGQVGLTRIRTGPATQGEPAVPRRARDVPAETFIWS